MPQLGETVTEGTITRWMKSVGELVIVNEPLFEVSTDKVDSEVPSPAAGVLTEIFALEGQTVEVGARLAVIGDSAQSSNATDASAVETDINPVRADQPTLPKESIAVAQAPQPARAAEDLHIDTQKHLLSPVVRRVLLENGMSETDVRGTGPQGRIRHDDVLRAVADHAADGSLALPSLALRQSAPSAEPEHTPPLSPAPPLTPESLSHPPTTPAGHQSAPQTPSFLATQPNRSVSMESVRGPSDRAVSFSRMRRLTAEHMVRSKATSPHAFIAKEVDFEAVDRVRKVWGERFKTEEGFSLTYLPFITRAAVEALRNFPLLNASVVEDSLLVHTEVNLGIVVDLAHEGLVVPVVHRAEGGHARAVLPDASATWLIERAAANSIRTTSRVGHFPSRMTAHSGPSSPFRSSTSPKWPSSLPMALPADRSC